jgi:hypothetical protein
MHESIFGQVFLSPVFELCLAQSYHTHIFATKLAKVEAGAAGIIRAMLRPRYLRRPEVLICRSCFALYPFIQVATRGCRGLRSLAINSRAAKLDVAYQGGGTHVSTLISSDLLHLSVFILACSRSY